MKKYGSVVEAQEDDPSHPPQVVASVVYICSMKDINYFPIYTPLKDHNE
jgi:hypothetical protein